MFYAVILDSWDKHDNFGILSDPDEKEFIFSDVNKATQVLKKYKNSRMKACNTYDEAIKCIRHPPKDALRKETCAELDDSDQDLSSSLESLSLNNRSFGGGGSPVPKSSTPTGTPTQTKTNEKPSADEAEPVFPSAKPPLLNNLRRKIEAGDYELVDEIIWSNPRSLITCSDSAVYLMAGPKYNAAHISARANKPDILALVLDTVTNLKFVRKLYPNESDSNLQDRANHLIDSYLNTPDPRQGNTPLHFACKYGYYKVVRVLLTFEGCDLTLRDSNGLTAEESTCTQYKKTTSSTNGKGGGTGDTADDDENEVEKAKKKILGLFKRQLNMPAFRDQLRKRLTMERRRSKANSSMDSSMDTSLSDMNDSFYKSLLLNQTTTD